MHCGRIHHLPLRRLFSSIVQRKPPYSPSTLFKEHSTKLPLKTPLQEQQPPRLTKSEHRRLLLEETLLSSSHEKSPHDWPSIMATIFSNNEQIPFGPFLMNHCLLTKNLPLAQDYLKYDTSPNLSTLSLFIKLCSESEPEGHLLILETYAKLKAKMGPVWDLETGGRAVAAICKVPGMVKEAVQVLESMKGTHIFTTQTSAIITSPQSHASIATAAFKSGDTTLGWTYLNQIAANRRSIKDIETSLIAFLQNQRSKESMSKVLTFLDLYDYFPSARLMNQIRETFEGLNYKTTVTTIRKGVCTNCGSKLQLGDITNEQFASLKDHFFKKVMLEKDVFLNTTPDELQLYKDFIEKHGPFDYVLDALNIGLSNKPKNNPGSALQLVVEHLYRNSNNPKILLIGRLHISNWLSKRTRSISKNFLIQDSSKDDPFIIYACLKSGLGSKFVSRDFMRQHIFRLGDLEMEKVFKRWRLRHQLWVEFATGGRVVVRRGWGDVVPLMSCDTFEGTSCHLPFFDVEGVVGESPYELPQGWVCCSFVGGIKSGSE